MTTVNVKDDLLLRWREATKKKREEFPAFVNEQVQRGIEELERKGEGTE
jgi:hypothetical protein